MSRADTINLGFQYGTPITDEIQLVLRADYERRGKQFWDPDNSSARNAVGLINARAGVKGERWALTFWSKNLGDKKYLAEYVSGGFVHLAPPLSYGIELTYNF